MWKRLRGRATTLGPADWLIVGLGNPGAPYTGSRHNIGRDTVAALAQRWGARLEQSRYGARFGRVQWRGQTLVLAVSLTYMNESGQPVAALLRALGASPSQLLVVSDDLDLPLGTIRLRQSGSSGGHRGLESIVQHVGTTDFPRLRLGIGRPPEGQDAADYVLSPFADEERPIVASAVERALSAIETAVSAGIAAAMSRYNREAQEARITSSRGAHRA